MGDDPKSARKASVLFNRAYNFLQKAFEFAFKIYRYVGGQLEVHSIRSSHKPYTCRLRISIDHNLIFLCRFRQGHGVHFRASTCQSSNHGTDQRAETGCSKSSGSTTKSCRVYR